MLAKSTRTIANSTDDRDAVWLDLDLRENSSEDLLSRQAGEKGASRSDGSIQLIRFSGRPGDHSMVFSSKPHSFGLGLAIGECERKRQIQPELSELEQYDRMLTWMIVTYFTSLFFGWGLLLLDYWYVRYERIPKDEPWASDVVIIGGASAVLSPIIQWGNTILQTKNTDTEVKEIRLLFMKRMLAIYVTIVGGSTLVAIIRFSLNEDGTLHHFIATTSNHLVLARISASLLSWGSGKLFIRWYKERLSAGPLF